MATIAGRDPVARPGTGSSLLPYGLFSVAKPQSLSDHQSVGGLVYQSPYCKQPAGYAVNCPPGSKSSSLTGGYNTVNGDPFVVLAGMECGTLSADDEMGPDAYTRNLVVEALLAGEQRLVENIFSTGAVGQSKPLSSGGTQLAAAANVVAAFSQLEAAFAPLYGLPAVIHVPINGVGAVMNGHLVDKDASGVWRTALGNAVVFGNYAATNQAGAAPVSPASNIYITGQVSVWRNDIFVSPWAESIDKSTNQIHRFAERTYIVTYECASVAIGVTDIFACC